MKGLYKRYFGSRRILLFVFTIVIALAFSLWLSSALAAPNYQINYQGKLTDNTGATVADGDYPMTISLYDAATGGTQVWTENSTSTITNGLFSIMLGSTTPLTSVDFNQTLYLGVNINSDGEMTPRKILGTVPSAFEAEHAATADTATNATTFDNFATTSFLRSDTTDTASGLLTFLNGFISNSSSTIANFNFTTATGTTLNINGESFTDFTGTGLQNNSGALTVNTTYLDTFYASTTDFDTSAELLAILTDETGTGNAVFSASPTFTGTAIFASASTSALTVSGNTLLNGSNRYLNFGTTTGESSYGFRDNTGTIEYKDDAGSWTALSSISAGGSGGVRLTDINVYTSGDTWSKPTNVDYVVVEVVGGGGGGGGIDANTPRLGVGGGGGGYSKKQIAAASLSATETVTVGSGGGGGSDSAGDGSAGSTSSFGAYLSANGGSGGDGGAAGAGIELGGAGGSATGGDINISGGRGGYTAPSLLLKVVQEVTLVVASGQVVKVSHIMQLD